MASINVEHVADLFARICGLSGASAHTDLVSRAVIKIQKALTVDELTSAQAVKTRRPARRHTNTLWSRPAVRVL